MRILQGAIHILLLLGIVNGNIISRSNSRLPMSLSTIITDLEAEGVTELSTATILASRSVTSSDRSSLMKQIFEDELEDDDDDDDDKNDDGIPLDQATAFGKQFGEEDEEKVGIAIANPSVSATAAEAATTALSTHGTIIFICHPVDLQREEGLFSMGLAPAIERLLLQRYESENQNQNQNQNDQIDTQNSNSSSAELIIIFQGLDSSNTVAFEKAKAKFNKAASHMLSTLVKPNKTQSSSTQLTSPIKIDQLQDVFETVEYLPESSATSSSALFRAIMDGKGQLLEPADAASSVASAVASGVLPDTVNIGTGRYISSQLNSVDLALTRKLAPIARKALQSTLTRIREVTSLNDDDTGSQLVTNFGALVDASITDAMNQFDDILSTSKAFSNSPIAKRKRSDLLEQMYFEIGDIYEMQLMELNRACFDSFRKGLSTLRISPNLPQEIQTVASKAIREYAKKAKYLRPTQNQASNYCSYWACPKSGKLQLSRQLKEFGTDRLNAARASGGYKPLPRKGVTVGLHWLLPKPFGNDYRQNPSDVYSGAELVYSPPTNKVTEIGEDEVKAGTGDWRRSIVPVPAASDMMFQFGRGE